METQDDFNLGTAVGPEELQQGQSDATLLKQVITAAYALGPQDAPAKGFTRALTPSFHAGHDQ